MHLTLDKQAEQQSEPPWKNLSAAEKSGRIDVDQAQIESEIAQQLVDKLDFNFVMMHLLNHFSDHSCQLAKLFNGSCELPARTMRDCKQAYRQLNGHQAASQILPMKAQKEVFQYRELNANAAKKDCDHGMPLTKRLSSE